MLQINNKPYIDTDPFLDIERLKSLESDILKGIAVANPETATFGPNILTNPMGGLTVTIRHPPRYFDKNIAEKNFNTKNFVLFESLVKFVYDLPFVQIGRIIIFYNDTLPTPIHADGYKQAHHHNEFLWLRTNKAKQFFIYDEKLKQKHYVEGYSAFFNEQSYHGSEPSTEMNFSVRVDGFFTNEFRKQLQIDHISNYNA